MNKKEIAANAAAAETLDAAHENGYAKKNYRRNDGSPKGMSPAALNYPEHIRNIALLMKNNSEIRRFTALGILNYLSQKGVIKDNSKYVQFKWNKFAVKAGGLMTEYSYKEEFFLKSLVASFTSFAANAQRTINKFVEIELNTPLNKLVNEEEVGEIVSQTLEAAEAAEADVAE